MPNDGSVGYVVTIHGQTTPVSLGDWILPEPDGEHYYPCKPDVFAATYTPELEPSALTLAVATNIAFHFCALLEAAGVRHIDQAEQARAVAGCMETGLNLSALFADKALLDWWNAHPLPTEVKGGPDDGHVAKGWAIGAASGDLRSAVTLYRKAIEAGAIKLS